MPSTVGMLRVAVHASLFMLLVADGSSAGDKAPLGVALVSDYSIPGFPDQWSRINKLYSLGFRVVRAWELLLFLVDCSFCQQ